MSAPLVPSPLDYIGRRHFGFYPAIQHTGTNAWMLGTSSWSEVPVINSQTGLELRVRVGIAVLFVAGLIAMIASASPVK